MSEKYEVLPKHLATAVQQKYISTPGNVYLGNLMGAVKVVSKRSLPVFSTTAQTFQIIDAHKNIKWSDWINNRVRYSLDFTESELGQESFLGTMDIDATVVHSDTLHVLKQGFNLLTHPKFNRQLSKSKHPYKGKSLHRVAHVEIG